MRVRYSRFALDPATSILRLVPGTDIANMELECRMDIHSGLKGIYSDTQNLYLSCLGVTFPRGRKGCWI